MKNNIDIRVIAHQLKNELNKKTQHKLNYIAFFIERSFFTITLYC